MSTESFVALSAMGADRPGIVAELTEFITSRGGNIEDSRMAILGAEFGVLLLVSGSPDKVELITRDLKQLEQKTLLSFAVRKTKSPAEHRRAAAIPCIVTAEALDHEGIVRAVAGGLHQMGINIVSLDTSSYNAPVTGSPLFRLEAVIDIPQGTTVSHVRKAMEKVAHEENIDIEVRSVSR